MSLKEHTFPNHNVEDYEEVFATLVKPSMNMDKVSRISCPELDYFILLSSLTSGRGYRGQEPYGMAYSVLESLCQKRKRESLPALAIQFGPLETCLTESASRNALVSITKKILMYTSVEIE